jgi:hypothetical protein
MVYNYSFLHRKEEMRGYLNKKSATKNRWKKFWFRLCKPYLYYYASKEELENEKMVDLNHCAVTQITDPEVMIIKIKSKIH